MLKLPHLNGNLMAQNFVTKFHKNLFSHSRVMCTHAGGQMRLFYKALWRDANILKKVLKFSLLNLANDKILNCGSLCREK